MQQLFHVGIDDTDSPRTGCTTHVCALAVRSLRRLGAEFIDYPNLVRLNPNVPWKTRGNGALCIRFLLDNSELDEAREAVLNIVEENSDLEYPGTDPAVVFHTGEIPSQLTSFSDKAIRDIVALKEALQLIKRFHIEAVGFKEGRGVIGALAAIGQPLRGDHTYELIAYREPEMQGLPRRVDPESVRRMDAATKPNTFNNIDPETGRVLITPRGPDPVLYGIRGESAESVLAASEMVVAEEPVSCRMIFRTNHGTDMHLTLVDNLRAIRPHRPVIAEGKVSKPPRTIKGGHVVFSLTDGTATVDCVAYEPTGSFREVARSLISEDCVEAYGGVRPASDGNPATINLEKIRILKLAAALHAENPLCPRCRRRMKSMGKLKGFRCPRCGLRDPALKKSSIQLSRTVTERLYIPPPRAHRHLTKPYSRYGREKSGSTIHVTALWLHP